MERARVNGRILKEPTLAGRLAVKAIELRNAKLKGCEYLIRLELGADEVDYRLGFQPFIDYEIATRELKIITETPNWEGKAGMLQALWKKQADAYDVLDRLYGHP